MNICRNVFFFLILGLCPTTAPAQQPICQVDVLSLSLRKKLPAEIASWNNISGAATVVAQKLPEANFTDLKLVVQLKLAGTKVCGNVPQTSKAIKSFTTRRFSVKEITACLSSCARLSPGSYSLSIQFYNLDNYPISMESSAVFAVEDAGDSKRVGK